MSATTIRKFGNRCFERGSAAVFGIWENKMFLVSHSGSKVHPANSFVMRNADRAADLAFRLEYNGAVGVTCRELTGEEYRVELTKRLPPHLRHIAGK